jgi:hypothetical protein
MNVCRGIRPRSPLEGARFCGNAQTLLDYEPPGIILGDRTLPECETGLATIVSVASAWAQPALEQIRVASVRASSR